jgi:UDP-2,4-diacetamido-2,4,6-trideoxy-beta-L-altropyranose hydrolase
MLAIFFRVDASLVIGTGHVMRCLAFAEQIRDKVGDVTFVCSEGDFSLEQTIVSRGYRHIALTDRTQRASKSQLISNRCMTCLDNAELLDAINFLSHIDPKLKPWVIVDHYSLGAAWETEVRKYSARVIAFDDLANRPHNCDVLIDACPGRTAVAYDYLVNSTCIKLIGSDYAILRPEFLPHRKRSLMRRKNPALRRILVTMGGIDQHNTTLKALDALNESVLPSRTEITVVLGRHAPRFHEILSRCKRMRMKTHLLSDVRDMASLMSHADLAIGAAGTTGLERCCLGLPTIQVIDAANQIASATAYHKNGAALTATGPDVVVSIRDALNCLTNNPQELERMARCAALLVDGLGAKRVRDKIFLNWI